MKIPISGSDCAAASFGRSVPVVRLFPQGKWLHRLCLGVSLGSVAIVGAQERPAPSPAAVEIAGRLVAAPDEAARQKILKTDGVRTDLDLYRALSEESGRLAAARRFADAMRGYHILRDVAEKIGHRAGVAAALSGIGSMYGRQGDYQEAARFLREGLAISEELEDVSNVQVALNNLGIVHRLQGEYEEALTYYQRTITLDQASGRTGAATARALNNIGSVQMLRGSYREALDYFQRSLRLKEANGQVADMPSTLENIGTVHELIGDVDLAVEYYRRSLTLNEQLGNRAATSSALRYLGGIYARQGRFDAALDYYRRALALEETAGRKAEIADTLRRFGNAYRERGQFSEALDYYRRSLMIQENINDRPGAAATLTGIAGLLRRQGQLDSALDAAQRASRLAGETGQRDTLWNAQVAVGESNQALGRTTAAREAYADALETIESLRGEVPGGEGERQRFLEDKLAPYHRLAALLVGEGRVAEALGVAERARARVMLDVLRAGRPEIKLLTLDERERERRLQREMTAALTRLWSETAKPQPDRARVEALEIKLRKARGTHSEFQAALYDTHPVLKLSRGDAEPGSLQDADSIIDGASTAILEFMVTREATFLFVISRPGRGAATAGSPPPLRLRCVTLPIGADELRARTRRFREQLSMRDLDSAQTSRELYERLLAPAEPELRGKTNLIIVPDGALWEVPFQALQTGARRYVLEDAAISYAPSIAVLREMRGSRARDRRSSASTLLALGDPRPPRSHMVVTSSQRTLFDPLPDAARQVRSLAGLYGAARSQVFTGADATEERLRSIAGDPTVLHLATHGVLDDASPMHSFLLLAGDADSEAACDGRLEAWEIMSLRLRADVVVLAACETARGRIGAGEGVIGLSWAFFLAGSPRTVVSLWKVDAASTTELMVAFHRGVRGGSPRRTDGAGVAAGLRSAALSVLRDPRYRHPFYWAGFLVIGDGS